MSIHLRVVFILSSIVTIEFNLTVIHFFILSGHYILWEEIRLLFIYWVVTEVLIFISSDSFLLYKIGHRALQHTQTSSIQDCKLYFLEKFVRDSK